MRSKSVWLPVWVFVFCILMLEDRPIRDFLQHFPPQLFSIMTALSRAGDLFLLLGLLTLLWGASVFLKRPRWTEAALWCATALILSRIVVAILQHLVGRGRPFTTGGAPYLFIGPNLMQGYDSFPSAHAACVFALAVTWAAFFPKRRWVYHVLAFSTAYSRIYLDAHFASDVFAGAGLGVWIGFLITRRWVSP